jgi:hypothetical protein
MKIVTLFHDDSPEDPSEGDGNWTLYSFSNRHHGFKHPNNFFEDSGKPKFGIRRKLEVGTAFILSYYEHGQCCWSLQGTGPQCEWDNVDVAGILVWEHPVKEMGAKSYEDRRKDAACFLETYTCWCNGEVYGFNVEEEVTMPCGHKEIHSLDCGCCGFYGNDLDYMASEIRDALDGDTEVVFKGEAKFLADHHDFVGKAKSKPKADQEKSGGLRA